MPDIERKTYIEDRLEAYDGFFDHDWKWQFMQVVRDTKIQGIGFDLVRNWEAASNARSLPWLMVKCIEAAEHRTVEEFEPLDKRKIRIFRDKIVARMKDKGEKMRAMFCKKLQETLDEIDSEVCSILDQAKKNTLKRGIFGSC